MSQRGFGMAPPVLEAESHEDGQKHASVGAALAAFFGRISPQEWRRRALHMLPGFLPLILWTIYHRDPLSWDARAWIGGIILTIGVATAIQYHRIARRGEVTNSACILGYTIPVFAMLFLIPAKAELGLATLTILAMGDGSATVGGLLFRGPRLPWNRNKSWSGLVSFIVVGAPFTAMIYWGEARPYVSFSTSLCIALFATTVAAICESLDARINDNVRVGIAGALGLILAQSIWGGW